MAKNISRKTRRHSGRVAGRYAEKLPFGLRAELDLLDDNTYWCDWRDYRDGMRYGTFFNKKEYDRNRKKTLQFKNKQIYRHIRNIKFGNKKRKVNNLTNHDRELYVYSYESYQPTNIFFENSDGKVRYCNWDNKLGLVFDKEALKHNRDLMIKRHLESRKRMI